MVKFEIYNDGEYWCGRGIGVDIFTQGKTLDELMGNVKEAVELHFDEVLSAGEDIQILSIFEFEVSSLAKDTNSGTKLIKLLGRLGYEVIRQRGSHVVLRKITKGESTTLLSLTILKLQKEHSTIYYQRCQ